MVKQPVIHAFTLPCAPRARWALHTQVCWCVSVCCTACVIKKQTKKKTKKQQSGHVHYWEPSATCNCGEATLWPIRHVCCGNGSQLLYPNQARGRALLLPLSPTQSQMTQSVTNQSLTTRPPKKKKLMGCTYTRLCPGPKELVSRLFTHTCSCSSRPSQGHWEDKSMPYGQ